MDTLPREFYTRHAQRYAQVSHEFIQSVYTNVSHRALTDDYAIMRGLRELVPPRAKGLDAGCGAGARDVFFYDRDGYDIVGIDVVEENIRYSKELHREIADRVWVADVSEPLGFPDACFDFVLCNSVIQHMPPRKVMDVTLSEFARVLKPGGILQLIHKVGSGVATVFDSDYGVERAFELYSPNDIASRLATLGLELVREEGGKLGGLIYFTDTKPVDHCLLYARKVALQP